MAFRNIIISNPGKLNIKNEQLIIETDKPHSIPLEDIDSVLIESQQTTITTAALSSLGEHGCAVYVCDNKHLPNAVLIPFAQHSREKEVVMQQINIGEVLRKHLWQKIVQAKIHNQARCLDLIGKETYSQNLYYIAENVKSGDCGNSEAVAALHYFPALFGNDFIRREDSGLNAGLNYGYAIIRGCVARSLTAYGFLPCLGLQHHNSLNNFNLADDLMEPFRPVIDLLVVKYFKEEDALDSKKKQLLFNSLNLEIIIDNKKYTVAYAIEKMVSSLKGCLIASSSNILLPTLVEEKQHLYE